jgi:3-hydroxybutyryl-CoA dehydratase
MTKDSAGEPFRVGDRASFTKTVTEDDVNAFARLIGDFNPLHVDEEYARRSRFGRRIAHGAFTGGLISTVLGNKLPGTGSIYLHQEIDFLAPVYLGDTVTATAEVISWRPDKRIITLQTDCFNQDGRQVASGKAVLMMDRPAE